MNSFFKRALIGGGGLRKRYLKSRAGAIQLNYLAFFTWCHDGLLVFQNNETVAMLVYQENPVGVELLSYVKVFFFPRYFHRCWLRDWKCSINSVLIREQPRILRKNKAKRAALVSFFKIMLNRLRLLPEISINYMSDIWANGISHFLTTTRCLWTLRYRKTN